MSSSEWSRGFALLGHMGLRVDMHIWPHQMLEAAALVADYPDTRVAVNHVGFPIDRNAASMEMWRIGMRALAKNLNVSVNISGLGMLDHHLTEASIRPIILEAIKIFGTHRSMFASNFPVDKLYSDYPTLYRVSEITVDFTPDERARLFSGAAVKLNDLTPAE